ncbi:FecCD family ABC transporter permease [Pseudokineococcus sp. 1T1Z-3]|uniref:FecCD family ABC transporter permease n=1 Tax=Pseudokineococcus sp. 1T1Z-3 TaxID=3132745 RepID=UPI0030AA7BA8
MSEPALHPDRVRRPPRPGLRPGPGDVTGTGLARTTGARLRWLLLLGLLLALAVLAGGAVGSRSLGMGELWAVLRGDGSVEATAVLLDQRVPRTLIALVAGAALAVAGAVMQAHTRNPLADPGLLGVTAGAALAVVLAIALLGVTSATGHLWAAMLGAAAAATAVTALGLLAGSRRDASPATLVLAGAALGAVLSAVSGIVLVVSPTTFDVFRYWSVGSLSGVQDLAGLAPAFVAVGAGLLLALAHSSTMDALVLGDDAASSLGRDLGRSRLVGLGAVTLLAAGAVACVGSLGFVGLVAPHLVRLVTGPGHRRLVPASALVGALLVLLADLVGRVALAPAEVPVGVVLGVVGAPAFVAVVLRATRRTA